MGTLILLAGGGLVAVSALLAELALYRDRMNQIADDLTYHIYFRDRIQ